MEHRLEFREEKRTSRGEEGAQRRWEGSKINLTNFTTLLRVLATAHIFFPQDRKQLEIGL